MTDSQSKMAAIFNEWARRYAANPSEFENVLGPDGQPAKDYGDACALYFSLLESEMAK